MKKLCHLSSKYGSLPEQVEEGDGGDWTV